MILNIILGVFALIAAYLLWTKVVSPTLTMNYYKGQGVAYMPGFPPVTDATKFNEMQNADLTVVPTTACMEKHISNPLPPFSAMCLNGRTMIYVNKADLLEDFYVKKNMYFTKSWEEIGEYSPVFRTGILLKRTDDPTFAPEKKLLQGAFFKKNLGEVVEITKSSTIDFCRKVRKAVPSGTTVDIVKVAEELVSCAVINTCIGEGVGNVELPYESLHCDAEQIPGVHKLPVWKIVNNMLGYFYVRGEFLHHYLFPGLMTKVFMPQE